MRRRIDFNRYEKPKEETVGGGNITGSLREAMCSSMELKDVLALVAQQITVMWVSDGRWSMHQLLMSLLDISGPADVHISSYALSETPARYLVQLKNTGIIRTLNCVLDNRVDTRTASTLQIIKTISDDFALVDTHAKVTVITNEEWNIAVVGSANYTENKRYEAGSITSTKEAADFQLTWIKKALKDGIK
jgi:hypothetical protein